MTQDVRDDIIRLFNKTPRGGTLDHVTGWYIKAAQYIQNTKIKVAFVSTNSISQGEQVGVLWNELIRKYKIKIHFAHRTFKWSNEARGKAAVYCVIIGFANYDVREKRLFDYEDIKGEPHSIIAKNINPYLVDFSDLIIQTRHQPLCNVPEISFGNMPLDGGNLLLTDEEKIDLETKDKRVSKFIKPLLSAKEFINGERRWCIWLVDANPSEIQSIPTIVEKVKLVKQFRENSIAPSTRKFASIPTLFRDRKQPNTYILIPSTTSENRRYIPMGFFGKNDIANNSCHIIPEGNLFHYGVLTSEIHMTWVKYVCGRLESRFRYSKDIVYNNFPWPENPTEKQIKTVEEKAQKVLDARKEFPNSSLADLYDPLTMPPALVKAHQELDKAVDLCYRPQPFPNETKRIEFLFELYEKYTKPLLTEKKTKKKK
jgi:hypothetical protein